MNNTTLWASEKVSLLREAEMVNVFTAGNDSTLDLRLAAADIKGSLAHGEMLFRVGLITEADWQLIRTGLQQIAREIEEGNFEIRKGVEDVHSQVELLLTERIGDGGKKIHTGRSRNDQVITDLKIFFAEQLEILSGRISGIFLKLVNLGEKHRNDLLPGYTHFQLAMPSSFGLWFGAYAEALCDDLELMHAAYRYCKRNPLGSGAGFGSPFPLDRELTTSLLGFEGLHVNSVYAQMSRGRTEKTVSFALSSVAATLSRFSYDVCLYMNQNFGFISFPEELTTGSSIMPHKRNPDVFELIRARCNRIQSLPNELTLLTNNLPSGYHRDMQLTKDVMFPALDSLNDCLDVLLLMLDHIRVKENILADEKYDLLFTVESVNKLVVQGETFRDAYMRVSSEVKEGNYKADRNIEHCHLGSIGKPGNELLKERFNKLMNEFR